MWNTYFTPQICFAIVIFVCFIMAVALLLLVMSEK
jgi:hypothetical protein